MMSGTHLKCSRNQLRLRLRKVERAEHDSAGVVPGAAVLQFRQASVRTKISAGGRRLGATESLNLEMHGEQHRAARENHGALDGVLKLSHISRPVVSLKQSERFG